MSSIPSILLNSTDIVPSDLLNSSGVSPLFLCIVGAISGLALICLVGCMLCLCCVDRSSLPDD